jgi:hypothetical protein
MRANATRAIKLPVLLSLVAVAAVACSSHHSAADLSPVSAAPTASASVSPSAAPDSVQPSDQPLSSPPSAVVSLAPSPTVATPGAPAPTGAAVPAAVSASAVAFLKSYFAAINAGLVSHSFFAVQGFFQPSCQLCQTQWESLTSLADQQEAIKGGALTVVSIGQAIAGDNGSVVVIARTGEDAGQIVSSNGAGAATSSFKAVPPSNVAYTLLPKGSGWVIVGSAVVK